MITNKLKGILQKCGLFVLSLGLLSTGLLGVSSASAVSPYDNLVNVVDSIKTESSICSAQDYTFELGALLSSPSDSKFWTRAVSNGSIIRDNWLASVNSGSYMINQVVVGGNNDSMIRVYFTTSPGTQYFSNVPFGNGLYFTDPGSTIYKLDIWLEHLIYGGNSCDPVAYSLGTIRPEIDNAIGINKVFLSTFDITYPDGYDGEVIPDTWEPPLPDTYPTVGYSVNGLKVTAHNLTDKEVDGLKDYPYSVRWQIVDKEGNMIVERTLSKPEQFSHTFEEIPDDPFKYSLRVILTNAPPPHQTLEQLGYNFRTAMHQLKVDGGFYVGSSYIDNCDDYNGQQICQNEVTIPLSCITDSFPFINVSDCIAVVQRMVSTLSFDTLNFGSSWAHQPNCYQLVVLGDWLNLDDRTMCPQFPDHIRNTVTPFVTFALGLMTILFISNRKEKYE